MPHESDKSCYKGNKSACIRHECTPTWSAWQGSPSIFGPKLRNGRRADSKISAHHGRRPTACMTQHVCSALPPPGSNQRERRASRMRQPHPCTLPAPPPRRRTFCFPSASRRPRSRNRPEARESLPSFCEAFQHPIETELAGEMAKLGQALNFRSSKACKASLFAGKV